jgi:micrococcal nuclease
MKKLTKKVLIWLSATIIISVLIGCDRLFGISGDSVERVSDGDTLVVKDAKGKNVTVRFACIDAPEKNQAQGQESKKNLERLIAEAGNRVVVDRDQYGRTVALVRTKKGNQTSLLQLKQITAGLAWPYEQFASRCPVWNEIKDAADTTKQKRIGIWTKQNPVPPWEFRKEQRQKRVLEKAVYRARQGIRREG